MSYGDIVWADLPDRGGHEQSGRRPVIVWQDTARFNVPTTVIIPLTTSANQLRYPGTYLLRPSATNGLTAPSVALVFQLGACDTSRFGALLGQVEPHDLAQLQDLTKRLLRLP